MKRIDSRTVELTPLERDIRMDADTWDENTDPHDFIYRRAAEYGGVVQEDFAEYLAESMVLGANGFHVGMRWSGSTVINMEIQTDRISLGMADGRSLVVRS